MRQACQRCTRDNCDFVTHPEYGELCVLCLDEVVSFHKNRKRCPDCGAFDELRGHMACQYPTNE